MKKYPYNYNIIVIVCSYDGIWFLSAGELPPEIGPKTGREQNVGEDNKREREKKRKNIRSRGAVQANFSVNYLAAVAMVQTVELDRRQRMIERE